MAIHYKFCTQGQINCHTFSHTTAEEALTYNLPTCSVSSNAISLIQLYKCVDRLYSFTLTRYAVYAINQ